MTCMPHGLCGTYKFINDPSSVPQTRILLTCCSEVSYFDGVLVINRLRKSILSCWGLGCGHVQKWPQESRFKHSDDPQRCTPNAKSFERHLGHKWSQEVNLKLLGLQLWTWAKVASGAAFEAFWRPPHGYSQKLLQKLKLMSVSRRVLMHLQK